MRKTLIGFLCCLLVSAHVASNQHEDTGLLRQGHPDKYTVTRGDTLWDISETFLNTPWLWPEIWHVNPQIQNPHLIFPGDMISLVYIDGKPRLTLKRGPGSRTVKLTPTKRYEPIDSVIPAIPLGAIDAFLTRSRVVTADEMSSAPYVVSGHEGRIIAGGGDSFYARDMEQQLKLYSTYGIFRSGNIYVDPDTGENLGLEALEIGMAKVVETSGDIATMALNSSNEEVRLQDRLLPTKDEKLIPTFFPSSPELDSNGKIIAVLHGVSQVGQYDVVAINRGERDRVAIGNVMAIYHNAGTVKDRIRNEVIALPLERAGMLMVFKVFEKMSYALVLKAQRPLAVYDEVRNP